MLSVNLIRGKSDGTKRRSHPHEWWPEQLEHSCLEGEIRLFGGLKDRTSMHTPSYPSLGPAGSMIADQHIAMTESRRIGEAFGKDNKNLADKKSFRDMLRRR
jgi:hypothetical protein